jgi:hypothetical protein
MKKPLSIQLFFGEDDKSNTLNEQNTPLCNIKESINFLYAKKGYDVLQKSIYSKTNNENTSVIIDSEKIKKSFDISFEKLKKEGWLIDAVHVAIVQMQASHGLSIDSFSELRYLAAKYNISIPVDHFSFSNTKIALQSYLFEEEQKHKIELENSFVHAVKEIFTYDYFDFNKICISDFGLSDSMFLLSFDNSISNDIFTTDLGITDLQNANFSFASSDLFKSSMVTQNFLFNTVDKKETSLQDSITSSLNTNNISYLKSPAFQKNIPEVNDNTLEKKVAANTPSKIAKPKYKIS